MKVKKKFQTKLFNFITFLVLSSFLNISSFGVEPNEILKNNQMESVAREISKNIRCMVCQNQSIDDSNAPLAKDLRILIRDKLKEGKNADQIYKFLTDRYGDFILLKPAFKLNTLALWLLPFLFLIIGVFIVFKQNIMSKNKT